MVKQGGVISAKDMPFFSALSLHRAGCRCKEIPAVGLQRYRPLIANSGVVLQRWGRNAKVGCNRKGGVETQRPPPKRKSLLEVAK